MEQSNAQHLMKRYIYLLLLLVAITLSFAGFYYRIDSGKALVLKAAGSSSEKVLMVPQGSFTIRYIHSVHKTPVEEWFTISADNTLILYEIRYFSLGVGMPYESEGGIFSNHEGQYRLTGLHREFSLISLWASEIPAQTIIIEGQTYPLLKLFKTDQALQISAKDVVRLVRRGS